LRGISVVAVVGAVKEGRYRFGIVMVLLLARQSARKVSGWQILLRSGFA